MTAIIDQLSRLEVELAKIRGKFSDKQIEVEARFGKILPDTNNGPISASDFYRFSDTMAKSNLKPITEYSTDFTDGIVRKTVIQRGTSDQEVLWKRKKRHNVIDLYEYALRIAISSEEPIKPVEAFKPSVIRTKDRTSYYFANNVIRLDLTKVQMKDENDQPITAFEIEAELLDINQPQAFLNAVRGFVRAIHGTEVLYSKTQLHDAIMDIKQLFGLNSLNRFNRDMLVQARNLQFRDMIYGGIVGNPYTTYVASHKADGQRKIIFFHTSGIWAIMPPNEYNLISTQPNLNLVNTYLDGEMISMDNRLFKTASPPSSKYWFLAFDCLAIQGDTEIQNKPYNVRIRMCTKIAEVNKTSLLTINSKEVYEMIEPIDMFAVMASMLYQVPSLAYKTDGFMFTPLMLPYKLNSHLLPVEQRVLTDHPDIVKWKPAEDLTIDFAVMKKMNNKTKNEEIKLYSSRRPTINDKSNKEEFVGTESIPLTSDMIDSRHPLLLGIPKDTVVEFEWNTEKRKLIPRKLRNDKPVGNDIEVAKQVWNDIFFPIQPSSLEVTDLSHAVIFLARSVYELIKPFEGKSVAIYCSNDVIQWIEHILGFLSDHMSITLYCEKPPKLKTNIKVASWSDRVSDSTDAIFGIMVSNIPKLKNTCPIYLIIFDKHIIQTKFSENEKFTIKLSNETIVYSNNQLKLNNSLKFPVTDILTIDVGGSRHLVDTYTLNYEKLMSEEEREFSRWIRVLIYDKQSSMSVYLFPPLQKEMKRLPVRRTWSIVTMDTLSVEELDRPAGSTIKQDESKALFYSLSSFKISNPDNKVVNKDQPMIPIDDVVSRILNPVKMLRDIVIDVREEEEEDIYEESDSSDDETSPKITERAMAVESLRPANILPMLRDDQVDVLKCSWYSKPVVRIGALGDGSCLLHSISKGYNIEYQTNGDPSYRRMYVQKLREGLAELISYKDPNSKDELTFYETASNGQLAILAKTYEPNDEDKLEHVEDFSIDGIEALLQSEDYLGDEVYALIGQILAVNIFILRCTIEDVYKHESFVYELNTYNVVIQGDGAHYETIGIKTPKGIQTVFKSSDPFIKAINSKAPGYVEPE